MESYHHLNTEQQEAVSHGQGPLLVLAGAGTGKTRVIVHRIHYLLNQGVESHRILAVTFTNKTAAEMRSRLAAMGMGVHAVQVSTFHALGLSVLKKEYALAKLRPGFCIYDASDQLGVLRDLMRTKKVADRQLDVYRILELILQAKRRRQTEVSLQHHDDYELAAYELYPHYIAQMRAFNAVDFDDLLLRALDVLRDKSARLRWAGRYDHILVDEFQDTSREQIELLHVLGGTQRNVTVVGDDDQSIYTWRGAQAQTILSFGTIFPGAKEVVLVHNYRSRSAILDVANTLIARNQSRKAKILCSTRGEGEPVTVVACEDGNDEVSFVVNTITDLRHKGVACGDIAVLYRVNTQSQPFEEEFALAQLPFQVFGGQAYFDRKEIRDAGAYLAVLANPKDEMAMRRILNVPPRGIGPASVARIESHAERHRMSFFQGLCAARAVVDLPESAIEGCERLSHYLRETHFRLRDAPPGEIPKIVRAFFETIGYLEILQKDMQLSSANSNIAARRLSNFTGFLAHVERFFSKGQTQQLSLADYLHALTLARLAEDSENDKERLTTGKVALMTLHSAKGLEFDYVFFVGIEEDLLPHRRVFADALSDIEEERRLCYVGMTRAREQLWMTWAKSRTIRGKIRKRTPSRFLQELPEGATVKRLDRSEAGHGPASERLAEEFFTSMRAKLELVS